MKKFILIALLACFTTYGQDAAYFTKIRNLDNTGADSVATEIASFTRRKFKIARTDEDEQSLTLTLVQSDLSKEDVTKALNGSYPDPDVILQVVFESFMEGQNRALEIKGGKNIDFMV